MMRVMSTIFLVWNSWHFFLWNIESPWIHEFISEKHFGSWVWWSIFPLNPTQGLGKFHFRDGGVGGLEVGCWFCCWGKDDMVLTRKILQVEQAILEDFWKWWGVSFGKYGVFLHVEVIRLTFLDLDEIGPLINQRLTQESGKVFRGFKRVGSSRKKKLEAVQFVSWVLDLPWALWGHVFIWGVRGHMGWHGQKNQQKVFFWSKMDFWPKKTS